MKILFSAGGKLYEFGGYEPSWNGCPDGPGVCFLEEVTIDGQPTGFEQEVLAVDILKVLSNLQSAIAEDCPISDQADFIKMVVEMRQIQAYPVVPFYRADFRSLEEKRVDEWLEKFILNKLEAGENDV